MARQARILLVDDRAENLFALEAILAPLNQIIVPVRSGREALEALLDDEYAVVLLDIVMPGMDGFETMRMVRQQHPLLPIVVISGRPFSTEPGAAPDFLTMATKLGAVSSLQKPFKPADLLASVNRCLEAVARSQSSSQSTDGVASHR